ncbi:MAG: hypothetical protein RR555_05540 [Bacteroidales bacterium]
MRILLIILLICTFVGCSTTRKYKEQQRIQFEDKSRMNVASQTNFFARELSDTKRTKTTDSTEYGFVIEKTYDTSKPVDITTGRPPLVSEKISGKIENIKKAEAEHSVLDKQDDSSAINTDNSKLDISTDIKALKEQEVIKKPPWQIWAIFAIVITLILYKLKKRFV